MIENTPAIQDPVYIEGDMAGAGTLFAATFIIAYLVFFLLYVIAAWRIFSKGGCPGWGIFVPIYNVYCLFRLLFGKGWLFLLLLVPLVNVLVALILPFRLGAVFSDGVGSGFALGLGFLFLPMLFILLVGLGRFPYHGPN